MRVNVYVTHFLSVCRFLFTWEGCFDCTALSQSQLTEENTVKV